MLGFKADLYCSLILTLGKLLSPTDPKFPLMQNRDNATYHICFPELGSAPCREHACICYILKVNWTKYASYQNWPLLSVSSTQESGPSQPCSKCTSALQNVTAGSLARQGWPTGPPARNRVPTLLNQKVPHKGALKEICALSLPAGNLS